MFLKSSIILISAGCIAILAVLSWANPTIRHTIILATTVQPEHFTELYFENHLALPSTITARKSIIFRFTVHNLEYQTMRYPYQVFIAGSSGMTVLDQNTFTLKQNQYKTVTESLASNVIATRSAIVVDLPQSRQHIDFWVNPTLITPTPKKVL